MVRSWTYTAGGLLQPLDATAPIEPPPPPPPPPPHPSNLWWVGLSRSIGGLNASMASKQSATLERVQQMAAQIGMTAAELRANTMWHYYNSGAPDWNAARSGSPGSWAKNNGFKGVVANMKTQDLPGWASGALDQNFRDYLASWQSLGMKTVVVIEHEPENNKWTAAQADQWCQGTARFMKITYDLADPNIIYSTCHIPNGPGLPRSAWNSRPALNNLVGTTNAQKILDTTLCGIDVYPIIKKDGSIQTIADRAQAALNEYKTWGFSRFYMPEVAFFNWKDSTSSVGPLTAAQQAKRIYDELWTWAKANKFEGHCYFDVTDVNNARGDSRTLDTAQEQLQLAKIIMNAA